MRTADSPLAPYGMKADGRFAPRGLAAASSRQGLLRRGLVITLAAVAVVGCGKSDAPWELTLEYERAHDTGAFSVRAFVTDTTGDCRLPESLQFIFYGLHGPGTREVIQGRPGENARGLPYYQCQLPPTTLVSIDTIVKCEISGMSWELHSHLKLD